MAAVSSKVGGGIICGCRVGEGGGAYCSYVYLGRQTGRQANLTDVRREVVVADASATESGMIKCIIDPPHEILG